MMGLQYLIEMKEIFKKYKLIPLATLKSKEEVKNISRLLLDNNIPIFELTLRDSAVYDIADEFQNFPEINLGIGTIKTNQILILQKVLELSLVYRQDLITSFQNMHIKMILF